MVEFYQITMQAEKGRQHYSFVCGPTLGTSDPHT
jgi:hypothetical protein